MRPRSIAAVAAACLLGIAVPATPANAHAATAHGATVHAATAHTGRAIGGPLLDSTGVIEDPLAGAPALPTDLAMGSWLVADADTGDILATKAPHERFLPASTLKTLTAVTLLPLLNPTQVQKASYEDAVVDGSKVGLVPGYPYTVDKLFTAMLVVSGNDAATALAEAAGGVQHTVALMNAEAAHLQAFDTTARTPSGLDAPGESSSAYDLALIARAGLRMPSFLHYVGTVRSDVPAPRGRHFQIYTHNRLLTTYRGDIGIKNGYTVKAGATYVGAARRGGHTILITLMHSAPDFWHQARELLDWGFAAEGKVLPVGTLVDPADPTARHITTAADTLPVVHRAHTATTDGVSSWEVAALIVSIGAASGATVRRIRRRGPRLRLPPI